MVFEGFCGIYLQKKQALQKFDAFGKEIIEDEAQEEEETKEAGFLPSQSPQKKTHLD